MHFEAIHQLESCTAVEVQTRTSVECNALKCEERQLVSDVCAQKTVNARRNACIGGSSWG